MDGIERCAGKHSYLGAGEEDVIIYVRSTLNMASSLKTSSSLIVVLFVLWICHASAPTYYYSRFMASGLYGNLQRFGRRTHGIVNCPPQDVGCLEFRADFSDMERAVWFVKLFQIVLPCIECVEAGSSQHAELIEAHLMQRDILTTALGRDSIQRLLFNSGLLSRDFAKALYSNIAGSLDHLYLPLHPQRGGEVAWESHLKPMYQLISRIYELVKPSTALFAALHEESYLNDLARLLHSPDSRERTTVAELLVKIGRNAYVRASLANFQMPATESESTVLEAIAKIMENGVLDIKEHFDFVTQRPIGQLFWLLDEFELILDKHPGRFRQITIDNAIPLLGHEQYARFASLINDYILTFMKRHKTNVATQLRASWSLLQSLLALETLDDPAFSTKLIPLFLVLYESSLIHPVNMGSIMARIIYYCYTRSLPEKLRLNILKRLLTEPYTENFPPEGSVHHSQILKELLRWLIDEEEPSKIQTSLIQVSKTWLYTPMGLTMAQMDLELQNLAKVAHSRLSGH